MPRPLIRAVALVLGCTRTVLAYPSDRHSSAADEKYMRRTEDSATPPFLYNISVTSPSGATSPSPNLTLLHQHLSLPATSSSSQPQPHPKRDIPRPIDHCIDFFVPWNLVESRCTGPQTYHIICQHPSLPPPSFNSISDGECNDTEICVDGTLTAADSGGGGGNGAQQQQQQQQQPRPRAWCVSKQNFVDIARDNSASGGGNGGATVEDVHIPDPAGTGGGGGAAAADKHVKHYISEAVLTGVDGKSELVAQSLTVEAMGYSGPRNRLSCMVPLKDGTAVCHNCTRLGIDPVPAGTELLRGQVVLEAAGAAGLMFLATISLG